ncbi:NUDIX hydrolase [Glycomyces sambucus]|uniref:NUDIX hydrolase n=1 Tax=Glycomyces sambucus TaxID=380244 RepID=UPI001C409836|nr:NUDIX domain-containing protein [Glycomyces sambucus]
MPITIAHLRDQLTAYLDRWPASAAEIQPLLDLDSAAGFDRATLPGHVTASAIVLDESGAVLLVHHRALDRWFQPGGHLEPGDDSLPAAALREAVEEAGLDPIGLELLDRAPIHIDVHPIPANPRKGEAAHDHYDVRYLFRCVRGDLRPRAEEVHAAEWRPAADLDNDDLIERLQDYVTR